MMEVMYMTNNTSNVRPVLADLAERINAEHGLEWSKGMGLRTW